MVEKLNLFLDLLQSYKVSSAVLLPARKLFRASLCSLEGVAPTGWKIVRPVQRQTGHLAEGGEWLLAIGGSVALLISSSDDGNLPKSRLCKEFKNRTG